MGLAQPRTIFGIHSITPYNRTTKIPYGLLKCIGGASLPFSGDIEQLFGGSNRFSWAAEAKTLSMEFTAKVKAYPGFLFELLLGATVTDVGADTAGAVTALTNANGTSLQHATTGVASIAVNATNKANLKFGKYVLKVLTATTVGLFAYSDVDFLRGTDGVYTDDTLLVTLATITITSGGATELTDFGLTLTGGSGTIAMTAGDTATFEVKPPSTKSTQIVIGAAGAPIPEFGALLLAQRRSDGEMFEIDCHKCIGIGFPIAMEEMAFSMPEIKMVLMQDAVLNRVATIRNINPSTV